MLGKMYDSEILPENHNWIYTGNSKNDILAYYYCTDCALIFSRLLKQKGD